ncbi:hypothetical protein [Moraxella lacunata]|uniref:hypothetical protein n=1 Tax=Moraxella lacunata TaxID=477 RepID=UPI003EE07B8E
MDFSGSLKTYTPLFSSDFRFIHHTSDNITGTSTNTPTTVANAAPEFKPNKAIATATANSKKLLVPIKHAGAEISCGNLSHFAKT